MTSQKKIEKIENENKADRVIIDLEATCGLPKNTNSEIIEIGLALCDENWGLIDTFQTFIKPMVNPNLTSFCTELTSITQTIVDEAPKFGPAFKSMQDFISEKGLELAQLKFYSWGNYDKHQFKKDCDLHFVEYPFGEHINIKPLFSKKLGMKKTVGMKKALRILQLPLIGTHHRGIDDTLNIRAICERSQL
jgi:inhibitor of KinA sporulation pathway (predicted exonuclease)